MSDITSSSYSEDFAAPTPADPSPTPAPESTATAPASAPRKVMPKNTEHEILKLLCTYLLYERGEETELRLAFSGLVLERHTNFHPADTEFETCGNDVCVAARTIMASARKQEIFIGTFAIELMQQFGVTFTPSQNSILARLVRKDLAIAAAPHLDQPTNGGRVVLTDSL